MWIWLNRSSLMHDVPSCCCSGEAGQNQADYKGRAGARSSRCGGQNTGRVGPGRTPRWNRQQKVGAASAESGRANSWRLSAHFMSTRVSRWINPSAGTLMKAVYFLLRVAVRFKAGWSDWIRSDEKKQQAMRLRLMEKWNLTGFPFILAAPSKRVSGKQNVLLSVSSYFKTKAGLAENVTTTRKQQGAWLEKMTKGYNVLLLIILLNYLLNVCFFHVIFF